MKITKEKLKQLIKEELAALGEGAYPEYYSMYDEEGATSGQRVSGNSFININTDPKKQLQLVRVGELMDYIKDADSPGYVPTPNVYTIQKGKLVSLTSDEYLSSDLGRMQAKYAVDEGTLGDASKKLRSKGAALAKKMSAAKSLVPFFDKLRASDEFEKAQFLAGMANNLGVNIADALSVLKTQQTRLADQPAPDAPEEKL